MHTTTAELSPDEKLDPQQLQASVERSLSRSYENFFSYSPMRVAVLAILTLGIAPLVQLRIFFRQFVQFERQQFWYVAQLLRLRGASEGETLEKASQRLRYDKGLHWLANLCMLAMIVIVIL